MREGEENSKGGIRHLTWRAFPMKESPAKGALFWLVLAFTVWAVYWNLQSLLLTTAAAALLLGSLTSFYLPTQYTLDENGVVLKRWIHQRRMEWGRIRSVSDEKGGLFLSPFPVKTRLENFRGLFLPYRGNREAMLEVVRNYIPDAAGLPDEGMDKAEPGSSVGKPGSET